MPGTLEPHLSPTVRTIHDYVSQTCFLRGLADDVGSLETCTRPNTSGLRCWAIRSSTAGSTPLRWSAPLRSSRTSVANAD